MSSLLPFLAAVGQCCSQRHSEKPGTLLSYSRCCGTLSGLWVVSSIPALSSEVCGQAGCLTVFQGPFQPHGFRAGFPWVPGYHHGAPYCPGALSNSRSIAAEAPHSWAPSWR